MLGLLTLDSNFWSILDFDGRLKETDFTNGFEAFGVECCEVVFWGGGGGACGDDFGGGVEKPACPFLSSISDDGL